MKVTRTTNYRKFSRSAENRALVPVKHKRLMVSMQKYGFLPEFPIVCQQDENSSTGMLIVKDGQHRLSLAETLGLPVYYCLESAAWDVALVNSTAKTWQLKDYAERYATQGSKAYREGLEFSELYRIPIGTSFSLLAGTTTFSNVQKSFLDGTYTVRDHKWADAVAEIYVAFVDASKVCRSVRFIEACMATCRVKEFDSGRLLKNLKRCRDKLASYSTRDANLDMMEAIYNFGRKQLFPLKNSSIMAMRSRNATTHAKK